jgi:transcriptional regulator with XRE-family HTH domain
MNEVDKKIANIVSENVKSLMTKYNLTHGGLAAGSVLDIHTVRKITSSSTNISTYSLKKISAFFHISIDALLSEKLVRLKPIKDVPNLLAFYTDNSLNPNYFEDRKNDNVVARFLRDVLINDMFIKEPRRASQVHKHILVNYKKDFNQKTIAKELYRMSEENLLKHHDKTGKKKVYYYWVD